MKRINLFRILVGLALILAIKLHAQDAAPVEVIAKALPATPPAAAAAPAEVVDKDCPVIVPALDHYAKLWTNSLFTSRALPPPEAPAGPNFTDNLSLSGTYEEKGKLTAILIDKSTSSVVLAYIGEDNPEGFRIVKVTPGIGPDQMKLQLQKGSQFGWVGFSNDVQGEAPPAAAPQSVLGTRSAVPSPARGFNNRSLPGAARGAPMPALPVPLTEPAAPPPAPPAAENSLRGGMPSVAPAVPVDIPLPPP